MKKKMKLFITMITVLLSSHFGFAQLDTKYDLSHRLDVGDEVPHLPDMSIMNYVSKTIDLNQYKDKVLILDFWDTFCVNCIALMPHVDQVQREAGDKAQVIMVNWQPEEVVDDFFRNNRFLKEKGIALPTLYGDTLLRKLFPHRGVPHTVFLYNGKVKAITYSDYIRPEFINELWTSGHLNIPTKDDFNTKLYTDGNVASDVKGKVLITGYQDDLPAIGGMPIERDSISGMFVTSLINTGILDAFMRLHAFIDPPEFVWIPGRIEWQVEDPAKYKYIPNTIGHNIWDVENAICYQRFSKDTLSRQEMAKLAMNDLVSFLGINVSIEKKERDVVVIRKTDRDRSGAVEPAVGQTVEGADILAFVLDLTELYPPAVDESGYKELIKVPRFASLDELNSHILYYGLEVVTGKRVIDTVVVKEL